MNKLTTPNLICLGAQKAGTTSLHDILRQHPDIYLPERKEAHFFDQPERYAKGIEWWMNEFFSSYADETIMGVMTPEYLYYEEVPKRIHDHLSSEIKLIIILRHPVDRAYSQYLMSKRRGFEDLSFEDAIEAEPDRLKQGEFERNHFSYIDRGRYVNQIKRYTELFPAENILFLSFEQHIRQNLNNTLERIQAFLDVPVIQLDTSIKSNVASETKSKKVQQIVRNDSVLKRVLKPFIPQKTRRAMKQKVSKMNSQILGTQAKLNPEVRTKLFSRFYADEIEELNQLTHLDFSYWKNENKIT